MLYAATARNRTVPTADQSVYATGLRGEVPNRVDQTLRFYESPLPVGPKHTFQCCTVAAFALVTFEVASNQLIN